MARFFTIIGILAIQIVFTLSSSAADDVTVHIDFKVFGAGRDSFKELYFFDGEKSARLDFHKTSRSIQSYRYEGLPIFELRVKNPSYNPIDPTSLEYITIETKELEGSMNEALVILYAHPENRNVTATERKFEIHILDDSTSSFKSNTVVVLNATGAPLFGKIDNHDITLKYGLSNPISYKSKNGKSNKIGFALETKDGVRLVMSNDIKLPKDRRILLILERPLRENSLRIQARMLTEAIVETEPEK